MRRALTALSAIAVLALGGLAVQTQLSSADAVRQAQKTDRDTLQRALSGLVEQYLDATFLASKSAAESTTWTYTAQDTAKLRHLAEMSPLTSHGAALLDSTGTPVAAWPQDLPAPTDPGYDAMRATGLSDLMRTRTTGKGTWVVAFAVPTKAGVLVTYADATTWPLEGYHETLKLGEGSVPYVLDSRGVITATSDPSLIGTTLGRHLPTTTQVGADVISAGTADRGWHAVTVQRTTAFTHGISTSKSLLALAGFLTGVTALLVMSHMRQQRKLAEDRLYDPLTGLAQRRLFDIRLEAALARQRRHGMPLALLYADLDGFKHVNDTLGHNAGDQVLRDVADGLRASTRDDDFVARLGGDEFVVLLEAADTDSLPGLIERITASTTAAMSVGGAITRGGHDAAELVHAADLAMYALKSGTSDIPIITHLSDRSRLLPLQRAAATSTTAASTSTAASTTASGATSTTASTTTPTKETCS